VLHCSLEALLRALLAGLCSDACGRRLNAIRSTNGSCCCFWMLRQAPFSAPSKEGGSDHSWVQTAGKGSSLRTSECVEGCVIPIGLLPWFNKRCGRSSWSLHSSSTCGEAVSVEDNPLKIHFLHKTTVRASIHHSSWLLNQPHSRSSKSIHSQLRFAHHRRSECYLPQQPTHHFRAKPTHPCSAPRSPYAHAPS